MSMRFIAMRIIRAVAACVVAGLMTATIGCGSGGGGTTVRTLNTKVPTVTTQPETTVLQDKGGLRISVTPVQYAAVVKYKTTYSTPVMQTWPAGHAQSWETRDPILLTDPDRVKFLVTVNNQLPRVFRGAGTVVQFNVDNQFRPVEQSGYAPLQGAIVPPRQEQQFYIMGPPVSDLKGPTGQVAVLLFDVVTNQDKAGTVTEKQNFEWIFDYTLKDEQRDEAVHRERIEEPLANIHARRMQADAQNRMESGQGMPPGAPAPYPGYPGPYAPPR